MTDPPSTVNQKQEKKSTLCADFNGGSTSQILVKTVRSSLVEYDLNSCKDSEKLWISEANIKNVFSGLPNHSDCNSNQ